MAQLFSPQDVVLSNYLGAFQSIFSAPQLKYFVTGLMGLLHYDSRKTLSGILQQVAVVVTMSGLIRFLIGPARSVAEVEQVRYQKPSFSPLLTATPQVCRSFDRPAWRS